MLVLTRRVGESIDIDSGRYVVRVLMISEKKVKISLKIRAGKTYVIWRDVKKEFRVSPEVSFYINDITQDKKGNDIVLSVQFSIDAPKSIRIYRSELLRSPSRV